MTKEKLCNVLVAGIALQAVAILVMYSIAEVYIIEPAHVFAAVGVFFIATWGALYWILCKLFFAEPEPPRMRLGIIDSGGVLQSELELAGRQSVVIGKTTEDAQVDIDLSQSEHPEFVGEQHAVLNCTGLQWYLEAVSPEYGVGLRKCGETVTYKLKPEVPYPIDPGDLICISYERITVRG